jgi:hypothetical protein
LLGAVVLAAGVAAPARAQSSVTSADIQRLQDVSYEASRDVAQARTRDTVLASQLQAELDDARDEVIYLKVKLRRNEPISRGEYNDVRDRIENIRSRARGDSAGGYTPPAGSRSESVPPPPATSRRAQNPNEIPVGTEFDVRLQTSLSSKTAQVEDRFEATTMVDLLDERGRVLVPSGSVMRGVVSSVNKATRTDRKGSLTVAFDQVTINGRAHPMRATVTQALESEGIKGEAGKIGIGAGAGAILGAILGGAKGAAIGATAGAGGGVAAVEISDRQEVTLPAGSPMTVKLLTPLSVTVEQQ